MVTQVEPVTNLQRSYQALFAKVENGPVILTNRGTAAAVLLSVTDHDSRETRLAQLERWFLAAVRSTEVADGQWVPDADVDAEFQRMGIA